MPNGIKQATNTFQVVVLNFHFCSMPTLNVLSTNSKKMAPWMGPKDFDNEGLSNKYFMGMAIKTNANNEIPSRKPMMRNRPIFVLNKCVILSKVRSVC